MNTVIFSLGTNMGERLKHLSYAEQQLELRIGSLLKKSNIYESAAWGKTDQENFLNQVLVFETKKSPLECLDIIQAIEKERFRERKQYWGPRTLDIDILFYNQEIINTQRLVIPHPFIEKRLFVLLPLSEIFEQFIHPILLKSISSLLSKCEDEVQVEKYLNGI